MQNPHRKPVFCLFGFCASAGALPVASRLVGVVAVGAVALLAGCGESAGQTRRAEPARPTLADYADRAGAVLDPDAGGGPGVDGAGRGWSVLVAVVPGTNPESADRMLEAVRGAGLTDARLADHNRRRAVVVGSFDDPGSDEAQAALARVHATEVGGSAPFAAAILIPPPADAGDGGQNDLRGVKARVGERAVYTLQIGVYARVDRVRPSPEELALFRREAELAASKLRGEGEEAFYYHGPNSSSVTIGVFDESDHDGTTRPPIESARLKALRERYPNNLVNGEGLLETIRTETGPVKRLQASRLVAIPD